MHKRFFLALLSVLTFAVITQITAQITPQIPTQSTANYEVGSTHALDVSPDGTRLFAINIPDHSLAVYSLATPGSPVLLREIPIGIGPVSVRARSHEEAWVVDQISDAISIVSVSRGVVVDTIAVADEPRDVVFAGSPERAFVSVATDRQVRVFDPTSRALLASIDVFGDDPSYLAVSDDGSTVWVAVQRSGNETTIVPESVSPPPPPPTNPALPPAPSSSLIVSSEHPILGPLTGIDLPDIDVVAIDAAALSVSAEYSAVGTILFGLAPRPGSTELWVANTRARNIIRFEPNLRGRVVDNRITRIDTSVTGNVTPFDLNPGIDYSVLPNPTARAIALAQPTDIVWDPDGTRAFVAAFGTDRVGVIDASGTVTARIDIGTPGATATPRTKRGPRGLALHPSAARLYVANRLSNSVTIVDTDTLQTIRELDLPFDPTPGDIAEARGFLYDAKLSGNGTASCAACHIDGSTDNLAWDLGDPGGDMFPVVDVHGNVRLLHPMKGPMLTQTLQGLSTLEPFHWRGDRPTLQDFNPAFDSLLGGSQLAGTDMDDFAAFIDTIRYPANPHRGLDDSLDAQQALGLQAFTNLPYNSTGTVCADCHSLDAGTDRSIRPLVNQSQPMKVAQLRNAYKRTGRKLSPRGRTSGFGIIHDGRADSVELLTSAPAFPNLASLPVVRAAIGAFVEAFDTGTAPAVGHVVTVTAANASDPTVLTRITTLTGQAVANAVDVVTHSEIAGVVESSWFDPAAGLFVPDRAGAAPHTLTALLGSLTSGDVLHVRGVAPGTGSRIGLDRDRDGVRNGDELPSAYGVTTPACATLSLRASSAPEIGNENFALIISGAPANTPVTLLLGTAQSALPFFDVTLLVDLADAVPVGAGTDAHGVAALPVAIPADPGLAGVTLFWQALGFEPCGVLGVAASNGLAMTVR